MMISLELLVVLFAGVILMCIPISIQMKWYAISPRKSIVISVALVLTGVFGSQLWYFIENLSFGGRSFYGAIAFAPIVFFPLSKFLRLTYCETMDFVAPAGCLTLALVKVQCLRDGCCIGKILYIDENQMYVRFPSQIVELVIFLILSIVLFVLSKKEKQRGTIYVWFLLLYGITRFILNWFRAESEPFALGLTAGCFWSLCSIVVAVSIFIFIKRKKLSNTQKVN